MDRYISVGWQAHRGEQAKTSVAKTGDAPSRLRISQLTTLNQEKSTGKSKSKNQDLRLPDLLTIYYVNFRGFCDFGVSRKTPSR